MQIHTVILPLGLIFSSTVCFGQAGRAELSGSIQDPSGRAVQTAKVEAEDQATMARYSTLSDERGEYHLVGLPSGAYVLTVERPGFRTYRQSGIVLRLGGPDVARREAGGRPALPVGRCHRRRAAAADGQRGGEPERGRETDQDPAAGRAQLHSAGDAVAGRGAAERPVPSADQRQPPAHERVPLRRHQRAAAGARPGGVLPDHRRHGRVQAQHQRVLSRIRAVERRHRHGDRKIRKQPVPRKPLRVLP